MPPGYIQEDISHPSSPPTFPIKLKFSVPSPDLHKLHVSTTPDPGHMEVKVNELSLQMKMSGVTCLTDFAEDEKLPEFMPLSVDIHNLFLVLEVSFYLHRIDVQ